jgi:UDP:flavonoid glycosyltransferase YjiC (YdhE family)
MAIASPRSILRRIMKSELYGKEGVMKVLCSTQMGYDATVLGQTMRSIAVARALRRRGHEVVFLAGAKLAPIVAQHGLRVREAPPSHPALAPSFLSALGSAEERAQALSALESSIPGLIAIDAEAIAAERPDVVLAANLTGAVAARAAGIPSALVFLQPHGARTVQAFTDHIERSRALERVLEEAADAAGLVLVEGMPELGAGTTIPFPWAARSAGKVRYTGPLLADPVEELPPRAELRARHAGVRDEPLVYATIGGGSTLIGEAFLQLVVEMFRRAPELRGFIATGLDVLPERLTELPDNVILRGFVPGTELVAASDVTVFHGGSSTLMTTIACGTPSVVVPSMAEQEDNAASLAANGAGIVLEKDALTPEGLLSAVQTILRDDRFRAGTARLQALGRRAGGATRAAELVESSSTSSQGSS